MLLHNIFFQFPKTIKLFIWNENLMKQILKYFAHFLIKIFSKPSIKKFDSKAGLQLEIPVATKLSDTEYVDLIGKLLALGYDQQVATIIITSFGSKDEIDEVNELLEIKSGDI